MINGDLYLVTASIGKRYVDGKELNSGVVIGCSEDCPENGQEPFKDCNLNGYQNSYRWVEEFATDQAKWAKAFGKAYERMLGEAFSSCYIPILTITLWNSVNVSPFSANGYKDGELEDAEYGCCTRCPPSAARFVADQQGCEVLLRVLGNQLTMQ